MQIFILLIFVFLLVRLTVAAYNYYSNPRLFASRRKTEELVSILIPARNEQLNLPLILDSVIRLKHVNYEVIVLDDHSEDQTFLIASEYASRHSAIRVLRGRPLECGWTGKNYACWQLAQAAKGDYLLFIDADVQLHPLLISSAVYRLKSQQLSLLSLFSNQEMLSLAERSGTADALFIADFAALKVNPGPSLSHIFSCLRAVHAVPGERLPSQPLASPAAR